MFSHTLIFVIFLIFSCLTNLILLSATFWFPVNITFSLTFLTYCHLLSLQLSSLMSTDACLLWLKVMVPGVCFQGSPSTCMGASPFRHNLRDEHCPNLMGSPRPTCSWAMCRDEARQKTSIRPSLKFCSGASLPPAPRVQGLTPAPQQAIFSTTSDSRLGKGTRWPSMKTSSRWSRSLHSCSRTSLVPKVK